MIMDQNMEMIELYDYGLEYGYDRTIMNMDQNMDMIEQYDYGLEYGYDRTI